MRIYQKFFLFFVISSFAFFWFFFKKNNTSLANLDVVKVSIPIDKEFLALKAFMDFEDFFDSVYVDSTDYFNLQNVLKLVDLNNFHIKEAYLQCHTFDCLLDDFHQNIQFDDYLKDELYISSFNRFINTLEYFLSNKVVSSSIGEDLLFALLVDYERRDTFNESKIVLNLKSKISKNDLFEILCEFHDKNFLINYLEFSNQEMYDFFLKNADFNHRFDLFLDKHYFVFSDDLSQLADNIAKLDNTEINSILMYVNKETMIQGQRYKKIRSFSTNSSQDIKRKYLDNKSTLQYLEDIKFSLISKDLLLSEYNLSELVNSLVVNINKIVLTLSNQISNQRYLYLQDCYFNSYNKFNKDFISLSPITFDFINSSIKNKYYNYNNNMYISKIYIDENNHKKKRYINEIFNHKTSLIQ